MGSSCFLGPWVKTNWYDRQLGLGLHSLWIPGQTLAPCIWVYMDLSRYVGSCLHHEIVSESYKGFRKCNLILVYGNWI